MGGGSILQLLKLVIVDDEPIILRGLIETYDWEQMGFIIVGSVQNGEKAIEVIKETKPHLVLTDICMKQMSGLTLMEKVKEFDNSISFIVISAYRDFEYAQKACEIGAFSYLLKPLDDDKLKDTMKAVYDYCISQIHNRTKHDNWEKLLMQNGENFQQVIVQKYLENRIEDTKIKQVFSMLNQEIKNEDTYICVCVDVDISCKITNELSFQADRFTLFDYLESVFGSEYKYWSFEKQNGNRIFLLKTTNKSGIANIKRIMEEAKNILNSQIISAISTEYSGFTALQKSYQQAVSLFEMASEAGSSAFTVAKELVEEIQGNTYSSDVEMMVLNSVRNNDTTELEAAFGSFIYEISPKKNKKIYVHKLVINVELLLQDSYGLIEEVKNSFEHFYANLININESKAVDICYKLLCNAIEERKKCTETQNIHYFSEYMSMAMAYIEENLHDESLTLASVAAKIYLNPVYFGRVFKTTKKASFKQYVLKRRMDLAKKLILEGKDSISSICGKVGMPNPSYFSQVFKQYTTFLPSEYKKECEIWES
jgi:two-component system, response regulator YesN